MAPSKELCAACSSEIYGRQKFLRCRGPCQQRFHLKCLQLQSVDLSLLQENGESVYICLNCNKNALPVLDSSTNVDNTVAITGNISGCDINTPPIVESSGSLKTFINNDLYYNNHKTTEPVQQLNEINVLESKASILSCSCREEMMAVVAKIFDKMAMIADDMIKLRNENHNLRDLLYQNIIYNNNQPAVNGISFDIESLNLTQGLNSQDKLSCNTQLHKDLSSISVGGQGEVVLKRKDSTGTLPATLKVKKPTQRPDKDLQLKDNADYCNNRKPSDNSIIPTEAACFKSLQFCNSSLNNIEQSGDIFSEVGDLNDGFKTVTYKKIRKNDFKHGFNSTISGTVGVAALHQLKAVKPKVYYKKYFLTRLEYSMTIDDVREYLHDSLNTSVICYKFRSNHKNFSSFYISVAENYVKEITDPNLWPEGALLFPFKGRLDKQKWISNADIIKDGDASVQNSFGEEIHESFPLSNNNNTFTTSKNNVKNVASLSKSSKAMHSSDDSGRDFNERHSD